MLGCDEGFEVLIEIWEVRMGGDAMKGGVVALISLVLPDMDFTKRPLALFLYEEDKGLHTKSITIPNLCSPATNKMDVVALDSRHLGVPIPY